MPTVAGGSAVNRQRVTGCPPSRVQAAAVSNHLHARPHHRLLVVGGGPAGVAAATAAARAGCRVLLAERARHLGGQLALAGRAMAHREIWQRWLAWAEAELAEVAVEVTTNTRIVKEDCASWDRVVVATGARPAGPLPELPGRIAVVDAWSAIIRPAPLRGSLVVLDREGGWSALDAAEVLATHGHAVCMVTEESAPGHLLRQHEQSAYLSRLDALAVRVLPHSKLIIDRNGDPRAVLHDLHSGASSPLADHVGAVVVASGRTSECRLWSELTSMPNVQRVGDAVEPRCLEDAIIEGTRALQPLHPPGGPAAVRRHGCGRRTGIGGDADARPRPQQATSMWQQRACEGCR
ncbi:FAD-dependent oxidoreductase [Streptomyces sp. NPDC048479]|uniref:FAD-dependent oxidoreductase n=1 Tax=Streptomyces sp. NPDC048479 TaxID=3154725 RepID=UPI003420EB85